jgi:glycosyltransferase involved in cell wall biosynthesis
MTFCAIKISVVIPCFRIGTFLLEAVESVLQQVGDFEIFEILIINDHSDDEATLHALSVVAALPSVRVLHNIGPRGSAAARNCGIREAKGKWIVFLDADDWMLAGSIQSRADAARSFPECEWIGGDFISLHRDGSVDVRGRFESNLESYPFLRPAYTTNTIVSMVTKRCLESIDCYDETLLRQQDYHLFLRLAAATDFVYVPQIVAKCRNHESNSTRSITHTQEWRVIALRKLLSHPDFVSSRDTIRDQIFNLILGNAYSYRTELQFTKAVRAAVEALHERPTSITAWKCLIASAFRRK